MQEDTPYPASILHVDRHVQSQPTLERFTVDTHTHVLQVTKHRIYYIARDEADREKDEDAQYEQRGDDQQQPSDDVGSHIFVKTSGAGKLKAPGAWSEKDDRQAMPAHRLSRSSCHGVTVPPLPDSWTPPKSGIHCGSPTASSSETHFRLQVLVDPEARKYDRTVHFAQLDFTAVTHQPRLGDHETWNSRSRYGPVLLRYAHNCFPHQPLLLLGCSSGSEGVHCGVKNRVVDVGWVPSIGRVKTSIAVM